MDVSDESEEEPFMSSGSEYRPSDESVADSTSGIEIQASSSTNEGPENIENINEERKKTRKRIRHEDQWKKNVRKRKKLLGQSYMSSSGQQVPAKIFSQVLCYCKNRCHVKVEFARQKQIFDNFYSLKDYDLQSAFLFSQVKVVNKNRTYTHNPAGSSRREKTRIYYLPLSSGEDTKVCKSFFKKLLKVSDGRISRVLENKKIGTPPTDKRGRHIPHNKTKIEKVNGVKNFIEKIPSYQSHYTFHINPDRKYLSPSLSLSKLYEQYKEETPQPVSHYVFSEIFNKEFDLHFHQPVTDSCKRCDIMDMQIKTLQDPEEIQKVKTELELHQRKAKNARQGLKNDSELAQRDESVTTITFDLMQTLPTPVLTTGICYYKRQLWTYCFGIHNMGTEKVCMYMWNESIASRGPQEIGSCIMHYVNHFVKSKKLIMYSDQCGGQNRNIKIALICNLIVSDPSNPVEEIDHKFLVSGHSYLPCDEDFGVIKKHQKFHQDIFVPDNWKKVVTGARKTNPFFIVDMTAKDFYSTVNLEKNITNRKMSVNGIKVEWLKIQWLRYYKTEPFKIFYKYSNSEFVAFEKVDISKRSTQMILELELLYPNGNIITVAKKKDLLDLLPMVPPIYHEFYRNLQTSADATDILDISDNVQEEEYENIEF